MKSTCSFLFMRLIFTAVLFQLFSEAHARTAETIFISENNQIKRIGDKVEFNCKIHNPDNNTLLWMKINKNSSDQFLVAINTTILNANANKRFLAKYDERTTTYTLKIQDLEASDTGYYQCQIPLDTNEKIFAEVKLDIERPPEITAKSPSSVTTREGEPIDLQCQADGYPMPQITWRRENDEILPTGNTSYTSGVLSILNADRTDRGNYHCIASNGVEPEERATIKLIVEFAPVVDTPRPRIGQARGHDAKLLCHVEANPTPSVTWLKAGKVVAKKTPHSSTDEFVHVHRVEIIELSDYGSYVCRVENTYGKAETVVELYKTDIPWIISD